MPFFLGLPFSRIEGGDDDDNDEDGNGVDILFVVVVVFVVVGAGVDTDADVEDVDVDVAVETTGTRPINVANRRPPIAKPAPIPVRRDSRAQGFS